MNWGETVKRPYSEVYGLCCRVEIAVATARTKRGALDRRYASEYHVGQVYYLARKAAHAAFRENPGLRDE